MSVRWFRLPAVGSGTMSDPYRPDTFGYDVEWSGNAEHPDGSPIWVVKVQGTSSTLDSLAAEPGVTELSSVPTQALNQMFGQSRSDAEWEAAFDA